MSVKKNMSVSNLKTAVWSQGKWMRTQHGSLGPHTGSIEDQSELFVNPSDRFRMCAFPLRRERLILVKGNCTSASWEKGPIPRHTSRTAR